MPLMSTREELPNEPKNVFRAGRGDSPSLRTVELREPCRTRPNGANCKVVTTQADICFPSAPEHAEHRPCALGVQERAPLQSTSSHGSALESRPGLHFAAIGVHVGCMRMQLAAIGGPRNADLRRAQSPRALRASPLVPQHSQLV